MLVFLLVEFSKGSAVGVEEGEGDAEDDTDTAFLVNVDFVKVDMHSLSTARQGQ